MKKFQASSLLFLVIAFTSCGNQTFQSESETQSVETETLSVDDVFANSDSLVGDTIEIEGVCSYLCRHGGAKAFVVGSADSLIIRCEAFPLMGKPFDTTATHHPIRVRGILREQRIDETSILAMEKQQAELLENAQQQGTSHVEGACETERAAQGQKDIENFYDRMANYRSRIEARKNKEGKAYLSFYYIDALSYETLAE